MKRLAIQLKFIFVFFIIGIGGSAQASVANSSMGLDKIVAIVNDSVITNSQLNQQIMIATQQMQVGHTPLPPPAILRQQVLQHMIDMQLQLQIAKKLDIHIDDATLDQAISQIAKRNGLTTAELQTKIAQQGMSYNQYREEIRQEMLISQVQQHEIVPKIVISDQEVTDLLNSPEKQKLLHPENPNLAYHLLTIIVPLPDSPTKQQITTTQQAAQNVITQLHKGADFQQFSTSQLGIQLNLQESDLGWRKLSQLPDLYLPYIKNAQLGEILGPIRAPNGFHIVKVADMQGNTPIQQNAVQTHVRHILIKTNPLQTDTQVKARLEQLRAGILNGADFMQVAMTNSQDPGSAGKGGDLGWVTSGTLDPTFESVMNQTPVGQISAPFKSQFGWHILQVLGRKTMQNKEELLRNQAKLVIYQRKYNELLQSWLQGLRSSGYVKIL